MDVALTLLPCEVVIIVVVVPVPPLAFVTLLSRQDGVVIEPNGRASLQRLSAVDKLAGYVYQERPRVCRFEEVLL